MRYFVGGRRKSTSIKGAHVDAPRLCRVENDGRIFVLTNLKGRSASLCTWLPLALGFDHKDVMIDDLLSVLEWAVSYSDELEVFCQEL